MGGPLRLDRGLQPQAYRPVFRQFGRLHIPGFLEPDAANDLYRSVAGARGWLRTVHVAEGTDAEIPLDGPDALPPGQIAALERELRDQARDSFQYVFDLIRVSLDAEAGRPVDPALLAAYQFVNSDAFLGFVREMSGDPRAVYADMTASRYGRGHYLTTHDDLAPDQDRLFAYVLNLSPGWRSDWGGILMFLDEDDHVAEGYSPAFNAINIFTVPQRHAVSVVAPYAQGLRTSLTGWIRSRVPAGASACKA